VRSLGRRDAVDADNLDNMRFVVRNI
jgi:hypothetical protein